MAERSQGEFDTVRREAHSLKGSSSYIGAVKVPRIAQELQDAAAASDAEAVATLIGSLGTALDVLRREAERRAQTLDSVETGAAESSGGGSAAACAEDERSCHTHAVSGGDEEKDDDYDAVDAEATAVATEAGASAPSAMLRSQLAVLQEDLLLVARSDGFDSSGFRAAVERLHSTLLLSAAVHDLVLLDGNALLDMTHALAAGHGDASRVEAMYAYAHSTCLLRPSSLPL